MERRMWKYMRIPQQYVFIAMLINKLSPFELLFMRSHDTLPPSTSVNLQTQVNL